MALKKLPSNVPVDSFQPMTRYEQDGLDGLNLNQAVERGLVYDLGDAQGRLLRKHAVHDAWYAIINGKTVGVSKRLAELPVAELDAALGALRFSSGISTIAGDGEGKRFFRLGMPAAINLGDEAKSDVSAYRVQEQPAVIGG